MMPMMGSGMFFWFIIPVLLLVGLIVFVMSRQSNVTNQGNEKRKGMTKSAEQIADERLATGDISPEEHQEIRQRIKDGA